MKLQDISIAFYKVTQRTHFSKQFVQDLFNIPRSPRYPNRILLSDCQENPCTFEISIELNTNEIKGHSIYSINYKSDDLNFIGQDQENNHVRLSFQNDKLQKVTSYKDEAISNNYWKSSDIVSATIVNYSIMFDQMYDEKRDIFHKINYYDRVINIIKEERKRIQKKNDAELFQKLMKKKYNGKHRTEVVMQESEFEKVYGKFD